MPPEIEEIEEAAEEAVEAIEEAAEEAVEAIEEAVEEAAEEAVEAIEEAVEELQHENEENVAWQTSLLASLDLTREILTKQSESLERLENLLQSSQTPQPTSETDTSEMTTGTSLSTPMDQSEKDAVENVAETVEEETRQIIRL